MRPLLAGALLLCGGIVPIVAVDHKGRRFQMADGKLTPKLGEMMRRTLQSLGIKGTGQPLPAAGN